MNETALIIPCAQCHARNRVPVSRTYEKTRCGKCHFPLDRSNAFPNEPVNLTDFSFVSQVLEFPGPVVVTFWTPRCGYCETFGSVFSHVARVFRGRVKFARFNIDDHPVGASRYNITNTPTVVFFKAGMEVHRTVGAVPTEALERQVNQFLQYAYT